MAAPTVPASDLYDSVNPEIAAEKRRYHRTGVTTHVEWRIGQLHALERMLSEREKDITDAIESDLDRGGFEAWMGDVATVKAESEFSRKHLRQWMRKQRQTLPAVQRPGRAWVQYEPLGVVLIIGPWNYPFFLTLGPLVAAIAAGNCAVIKPSELSPASSRLIADLVPQYLDQRAFTVVEGDAAATQDLLAQGFDHAVFTGGTEIGAKVMAAAAPTLTPVTLELGGKSPVYVAADADLDVAARRIAWTKMTNSGQTCIAPDYVLADPSIIDELVSKIAAANTEFRADKSDPKLKVVNERQFARLASYLDSTTGTLAYGGGIDSDQLRIEPTIVVNPSWDDALMQNEIFGPILPVLSVASIERAIDMINSRPKPLACYIFTASDATAERVINSVPSGGTVVNHAIMHCMVPQLPFGGVGASGMGAYHGRWGFEALSHRKAVLTKTTKPDLSLIYPPYSDRAVKLLKRLF